MCDLPNIAEVNAALINKTEILRNIAKTYSVSLAALWRHKQEHIPRSLSFAVEAAKADRADDLMALARAVLDDLMDCGELARKEGKLATFLGCVREIRGFVELLLKAEGQLQERMAGPTQIQVVYGGQTVIGGSVPKAIACDASYSTVEMPLVSTPAKVNSVGGF